MESILFALEKVVPVFLLIFLGMGLKKINVMEQSLAEEITRLAYKVFLPVSIFEVIFSSEIRLIHNLKLVGYYYGVLIAFIVILWAIVVKIKIDRERRPAIIQASFRGNNLLIGVPIIMNMYGADGAVEAIILLIASVPFCNGAGIILFNKFDSASGKDTVPLRKYIRDILMHPLIIAAVAGFICRPLSWLQAGMITSTISQVSDIAIPITLIAMGAAFNVSKMKENRKAIIWITNLKLVILPACGILIGLLLSFDSYEIAALVSTFAAPTAVVCYMMAADKNMGGELAAEAVVVTTFVSIFTITGFVALLHGFGYL